MDLPLHPLVVHLPMALAALLPVTLAAVLWFGRRAAEPRRLWRLAVAVHLGLALSAWAAVQTGSADEDRVETAVPEAALEAHEDRAETFHGLAWLALAVAAVGLVAGPLGSAARYASAGLSVVLLVAAVGVGHAGGTLVYRYDAARPHALAAAAGGTPGEVASLRRGDDDD